MFADNRWHCWTCGKSSYALSLLEKRPCDRSEIGTHTMWYLGGHRFCCRCGARTEKRYRLLNYSCPGLPTSATKARELAKLKQGFLPGSKKVDGMPRPCTVSVASVAAGDRAGAAALSPAADEFIRTPGLLGELLVGERPPADGAVSPFA